MHGLVLMTTCACVNLSKPARGLAGLTELVMVAVEGSRNAASKRVYIIWGNLVGVQWAWLNPPYGWLQKDELLLDRAIQTLKQSIDTMTEDPANKSRLYVTEQDIAKVANTADDILLAVKAPQGTTLEVPDPDQDTGERRYR